jgi:hypothetical protein
VVVRGTAVPDGEWAGPGLRIVHVFHCLNNVANKPILQKEKFYSLIGPNIAVSYGSLPGASRAPGWQSMDGKAHHGLCGPDEGRNQAGW